MTALVVGLGVATWQWREAEVARQDAVTAKEAAVAERAVEEQDGDLVFAGVVLAVDAHDFIAQRVVAVRRLDELLQAAFRVFEVFDRREAFGQWAVEGERDAAHRGEVAIEVDRADESFERVFVGGGARAASGGFFAPAEHKAGG